MRSENVSSKGETLKWTWCGEKEERNECINHIYSPG